MKVSIIVTAYNKEKYIKKCLESVISQDCDNWELIITEDKSTDRTKEIIEEYIKDVYTGIKLNSFQIPKIKG
ncbi:MAG: glycosyltransferase family 2 protein [Lachnospiraceae bacterium]|nr:glycosyltransferase family 2 protein [Lachnospiraceae bacterium]